MKKFLVLLSGLLIMISISGNASATLITFDEFAPGTVISTQYAGLGVTFLAGTTDGTLPMVYPDGAFPSEPVLTPNGTGYVYAGDFTMDFAGGINDILFDSGYWDTIGTGIVNVYGADDSTLLASLTNAATGIFTFDLSAWTVGSVYFNSLADGAGSGIDNLSFTEPVPEPATILLFGLGILGLAGVSRKKLSK